VFRVHVNSRYTDMLSLALTESRLTRVLEIQRACAESLPRSCPDSYSASSPDSLPSLLTNLREANVLT